MNRSIIALLASVFFLGCMTPDGVPPAAKTSEFVRWFMNHRAKEWVRDKAGEKNVRMTYVECKESADGGQTWGPWKATNFDYSKAADAVLGCLEDIVTMGTYKECTSLAQSLVDAEHFRRIALIVAGNNRADVSCRQAYDPGFSPAEVPADLVDPDSISPDDIVSAFLRGPAPLPGGAFPLPFPILCPLGNGGCPNHPDESFGNGPDDSAGSTGGDP